MRDLPKLFGSSYTLFAGQYRTKHPVQKASSAEDISLVFIMQFVFWGGGDSALSFRRFCATLVSFSCQFSLLFHVYFFSNYSNSVIIIIFQKIIIAAQEGVDRVADRSVNIREWLFTVITNSTHVTPAIFVFVLFHFTR